MTWGAQQGTSLHDHAGWWWCVESVRQGSIEVLQFELVERRGTPLRLALRDGDVLAGGGVARTGSHAVRRPAPPGLLDDPLPAAIAASPLRHNLAFRRAK
jgi:hypothetical protein